MKERSGPVFIVFGLLVACACGMAVFLALGADSRPAVSVADAGRSTLAATPAGTDTVTMAAQTNGAPLFGGAAGIQTYVSLNGAVTLTLNWKEGTFSRSLRIESLRVGTGTEAADRAEMTPVRALGSSALGESARARKVRVRNNEGRFSIEGESLVLVVTEGFCPDGRTSKLVRADRGETLRGDGPSGEFRLVHADGR